jgi:hypothetical protein
MTWAVERGLGEFLKQWGIIGDYPTRRDWQMRHLIQFIQSQRI